jgi:phosphatidylglycerophosphatase A
MSTGSKLILFLARGFGTGQIPVAPGTFGAALGMAWFIVLLLPRSPLAFVIALAAGAAISVWICGAAENLLKQTDPASVVLDEIVAVPICFSWWVFEFHSRTGAMPGAAHFFTADTVSMTLGVFVGFRVFDIWKPWPIRQSQKLRGGWGVTADDLMAAVYVNLLTGLALQIPAIANSALPVRSL